MRAMKIHDGSVSDRTNFSSDRYLQINSCGFHNILSEQTILRRDGRKDYHILMVVNGRSRVWYENAFYDLEKGNFVIYTPGEKQEYINFPGTTTLWCHFCGSIVGEVFDELKLSGGVYFIPPNNNITEVFTDMIRNFHQEERKKFSNAYLLELLYHIADGTKNSYQRKYDKMLVPILTFINANYNKQITLEALAEKTGYSKSRFSHIFSEFTGTTPIKYLNEIRLKNACELLCSTNLTINNIAFSCGFCDQLYFCRQFRKKYNMSPSEYRKSK